MRPLTVQGRAIAERLAAALETRHCRFDAILCSPLLRARQTAEPLKRLLAEATSQFAICEALASGHHDPDAVCGAIAELGVERIAVVGHLPDIAELAGYLLGIAGGAVEFEWGTAAFFECGSSLRAGHAALDWLITPEWY